MLVTERSRNHRNEIRILKSEIRKGVLKVSTMLVTERSRSHRKEIRILKLQPLTTVKQRQLEIRCDDFKPLARAGHVERRRDMKQGI
jgi:hypothetical protein